MNAKNDFALHSTLKPGEISPNPVNLHGNWDFSHFTMERWAMFRAVPILQKGFDGIKDAFHYSKSLHFQHYNEVKTTKLPSLWAYFETLPQWARDHPCIRDIFMGFEYHKPQVSMRNKEVALNFASSLILPMDEEIIKMMKIVFKSFPIRLNTELGKEMVAEMPDWKFDPMEFGSEHKKDNTIEADDNTADGNFGRSKDSEKEERMKVFDDLLGDPKHIRKQIAQIKKEQRQAAKFEIEGGGEEEILHDFKTKPWPEMEGRFEEGYQPIPMDYYDNDDGYWDEFIAKKQEKIEEYISEEMIIGRPFFKH